MIFPSQAEAREWANEKQETYNEAGNPVKYDVVAADATRRRWKAVIYLKV
ncbi:hypothetical protein [Acinetobacter sp.]|nr:hypothetical protein [Acinetobacter sp.]